MTDTSRRPRALFAAISIGVVPTLGLYVILNEWVIDGMTAGAVKG